MNISVEFERIEQIASNRNHLNSFTQHLIDLMSVWTPWCAQRSYAQQEQERDRFLLLFLTRLSHSENVIQDNKTVCHRIKQKHAFTNNVSSRSFFFPLCIIIIRSGKRRSKKLLWIIYHKRDSCTRNFICRILLSSRSLNFQSIRFSLFALRHSLSLFSPLKCV